MPESIMPVACIVDLYWLDVTVGLKLAVCVKGSLLDVLNLLLTSVPHRHKVLLQPVGRMSLFFSIL